MLCITNIKYVCRTRTSLKCATARPLVIDSKGPSGAATHLDRLVGEGERGVEEVNIRCASLVVCIVLLKSTLVGGVVWNVFLTITWNVTLTIQLVGCVAFEN